MTERDVVKELDHWIEETLIGEVFRSLLHRAHDEIVALREAMPGLAEHYIRQARAEAVEEAARLVDEWAADGAEIVAAIRALKDQPHP